MWDNNEDFRDDYLWDVEHGYYDEAEELLDEDEDDEIALDLDGFELDELEEAGIDIDEFELLDEDEKIRAILRAGLDPDDYDFL